MLLPATWAFAQSYDEFDFDQAMETAKQLMAQEKRQDSVDLALALMKGRRFDEALDALDRFIELDGDPDGVVTARADCLVEVGEPDAAIEVLNDHFKVMGVDPDSKLTKGNLWNLATAGQRQLHPVTIQSLAILAKARMKKNLDKEDPEHSVAMVINHLHCRIEALFHDESSRADSALCDLGNSCAIYLLNGFAYNTARNKQEIDQYLEMLSEKIEAPKEKALLQTLRRKFKRMK